MNRRDLLKSMTAGAAVSAAEAMFPGVHLAPAGGAASTATAQTGSSEGGVAWRKTPCRFCGVGCGRPADPHHQHPAGRCRRG